MISCLIVEFNLSGELQILLKSISPAVIERKLRKAKEWYRLKGIQTTKLSSLLKNQIPVRVCFDWNKRRPEYFELDTVSRCGERTLARTATGSLTAGCLTGMFTTVLSSPETVLTGKTAALFAKQPYMSIMKVKIR
jgi:hypothetical protein